MEVSAPSPQDSMLWPIHSAISPWVLFSRIWKAAMGYPPGDFVFIPGKTILSTAKETAAVIGLYYLVIFYGRKSMRSRPAFEMTTLFLLHNLLLSVLSAFLLSLFIEELAPGLWAHGIYQNICGTGGWTKRLVTLYYVSAV